MIIISSFIVLTFIFLITLKWLDVRKKAVQNRDHPKSQVILFLFGAFMATLPFSSTFLDLILSVIGVEDYLIPSPKYKFIPFGLFIILSISAVLIFKKPKSNSNDHSQNITTGNITAEKVSIIQNNYSDDIDKKHSPSKYISNQDIIKTQSIGLPRTECFLFGREEELSMLDDAWELDNTNIVILKAFGGVGKTALINKWVKSFHDKADYRGAKKIFQYSFYSRDITEGSQASADDFFEEALQYFGYEGDLNLSTHTKGLELAKLVNQQKTLLILDGLEPIQHNIDVLDGELKDRGLRALLLQLSMDSNGLCLISTRKEVIEIQDNPLVLSQELCRLNTKSGVELLKKVGAKGTLKDLESSVEEMDGHALALNLLGGFVLDAYDGDIRQRDKIPTLYDDPSKGSHAQNIMAAYESYLRNSPELHILYLLSLFNRPASYEAFQILLKTPLFKPDTEKSKIFNKHDKQRLKFTKKIRALSDVKLGKALRNLRKSSLLNKEELSLHPLVSDYFGKRLKESFPIVWRLSHMQLYEYFKSVPTNELPKTLKEMEPLITAVAHACSANIFYNAIHEIYYPRILGKEELFLTNRLGAFGTELTILSGFFEKKWYKPVNLIDKDTQINMLIGAVTCLRALGRYKEAEGSLKVVVNQYLNKEDFIRLSSEYQTLSTLNLIQGNIAKAFKIAKQSLEYARKISLTDIKSLQVKIAAHTSIAHALFQSGDIVSAKTHFLRAEMLQKESDPDHPQLYSTYGYKYGDFLIAEGNWNDAGKRAKRNSEWWANDFINSGLLDLGLDPLIHTRSKVSLIISKIIINSDFKSTNSYTKNIPTESLVSTENSIKSSVLDNAQPSMKMTITQLNIVIDKLRSAGAEEFIIDGLFARTRYHRHCLSFNYNKELDHFKLATQDLSEIYEIVYFSGMQLALVDNHLESARLSMTMNQLTLGLTAEEHIKKAKLLIIETGYKRRSIELKYLEEEIVIKS